MSNLIQYNDFRQIVLNQIPLIDVRAPVEFEKGAFPNAINLPILDDEQRQLIGIEYKNSGNEKAIELGHKLVCNDIKDKKINAWLDFKKKNPSALLYCFRGGQRSKISQAWMSQSREDIGRLEGGYKAFRNFLINEIEKSTNFFKPIVLGGRTGSGKTIFLRKLENSIDLENLANHRGSSFGRKLTPQPTQINFENSLVYDVMQKIDKGLKTLVFEDEGNHVGSLFIPKNFAHYLSKAPLYILETSQDERVEIILDEYIIDAQKKYKEFFAYDYITIWKEDMYASMQRIKKRLGALRYTILCTLFDEALKEQDKSNSFELYKEWIIYLFKEYYDPMYDYQMIKNSEKIKFRGSKEEILHLLENV